ncbi:hypothetical protein MMC09_001168 [Bachmanniomyces sp. S44760]|nr:hypothetical protein [Bachmanniomyces sp. S44760]
MATIPTLPQRSVVSSFLCTGDPASPSFRVSIFKRSEKVHHYKGLWAACSGSIDASDSDPHAAALREISEETSLPATSLQLLKAGESFEISDEDISTNWTIYPFVWKIVGEPHLQGLKNQASDEELQGLVKLDWEHTEVRFIKPDEMKSYQTVTDLGRSLSAALDGIIAVSEGKE